VGDLRRALEKHASYLLDIVTPDARRRRIRQSFAERFDAGVRLVQHIAEKKEIEIVNKIPSELKSPPMFPAELTTVFSNLLTNAVKATGKHGRIKASGKEMRDERIQILIENTGVAVDLNKGERWFKPFESTTTAIDPVLGQGMGLGLPITRSLLEEYGGDIRFVEPSQGFATALAITFVMD
jgi:signal transduction histidine kinase